jgi:hypothetical protein
VEQEFVERARQNESAPVGWPAALLLFHLGMSRERMRNSLNDLSEGREPTPPPANIDEVNDAELPNGIGTPLADAAARADHLLTEIIELYARVGQRPFQWYLAKDTTEAVLRNSYVHPRIHMFEYLRENGEQDPANQLFEEMFADMQEAAAPPGIMTTARYKLACARSRQGRGDEALKLLEEVLSARPEMKQTAAKDPDLQALREDPRFQELVKS